MQRRYFAESVFGDGLRRPLAYGERQAFAERVEAHYLGGRIGRVAYLVARALVRRLGKDGRLDPSHARIAEWAGCCERAVRDALKELSAAGVGLVTWVRRLVRVGRAVQQATNSYALHLGDAPPRPRTFWAAWRDRRKAENARGTADGNECRESPGISIYSNVATSLSTYACARESYPQPPGGMERLIAERAIAQRRLQFEAEARAGWLMRDRERQRHRAAYDEE